MKKLAALVTAALLCLAVSPAARAEGTAPPETKAAPGTETAAETGNGADEAEYIVRMEAAAVTGDGAEGRAAEAARNAALDARGEAGGRVSWDELYLLAKGIYAVTGNRTFTEEWRLCVGEVILNRVASPEFPATLDEVLRTDTRYSGTVPGYFNALRPDGVCVDIAWRLLRGERVMDDPRVVYQDCHYYDGGVCKSLYDYRVGGIFFCYTTHPELYGD